MPEPTIDRSLENEIPEQQVSVRPDSEINLNVSSEKSTDTDTDTDKVATEKETVGSKIAETVSEAKEAADNLENQEKADFHTDYKYKVREEEHEIDEWARPYIKDEETLKKFQDLYTRGHGLKLAKQERDEIKDKYTNVEKSLNLLNGYVQEYYQNPQQGGDAARKFIDSLGLPKEMFLQYALGELKYQQMTPEQRQEIDTQRNYVQQVDQLQNANQGLLEQNEQIAINQRKLELSTALQDANTAQIASGYDVRVGRQGAFYDLVVERGIFHSKVNGKDIPVNQAISEVVNMLGEKTTQGTVTPNQTGQQVGTQQAQNIQQTQQQKPVLPNISGYGTASPTKRVVNSIQDIRNRYQQITR